MQTFLSSLQGVLMIFLILALGYYLARIKWFDEKIADLFVKLVLNVSLPLKLVVNISSTLTKKELLSYGRGILIPFFSIFLSYLIACVFAWAFKVDRKKRGTFAATFSFSNSIFVGLPMCQALFGEEATPYSLMYYIASTFLWWTLGVYGIACDASEKRQDGLFSLSTLKRMINPPILGFMAGLALLFLNIKLPDFIFKGFKMVGEITTPLSLFYVGIVIYEMGREKFEFGKEAVMVFLGRFIITPALVLVLNLFIKVPELMRNVFIIMSAMPVMVNTSILARVYGADYEFAINVISYTTLFSIVVMPFLMLLIGNI
ncbi:MAG: malate permease [Tepidanaerobacteraceae bacterium]|nr:malate permease [Tepidanaerobacteraceae bacterium]